MYQRVDDVERLAPDQHQLGAGEQAADALGLERHDPLPNALYALYQREYGVNIVSAEEELRADVARKDDCRRLKVPAGTPLLHIDRVAVSLEGTRVEWRTSRCDTSHFVYAVTIA